MSKLAWPFRFMRLHPSLKSGQIFCVFSAAHGVFLIVFAGGINHRHPLFGEILVQKIHKKGIA